jgi:transglutaminase-like putative cysteine protease
VVSLAWLVKREYFRPTAERLAEAALAVPPGAVFYQIEAGGRQIGFASTTVDTLADSIRVEEVLVLDAPAAGAMRRQTARSVAVLTRALRLRSVSVRADADGGAWTARGEVAGDSAFRLTLVTAVDSHTTRWPLTGPIVVPSLLPLRLAFGGVLARGGQAGARLFDPVLLAEREVAVRVAAESTLIVPDSAEYDSTAMAWVPVLLDTVRVFAVEQDADGRRARLWVDAQGRVMRVEQPNGVVLERSAFEIAYENFRHRDTVRLVRASAAPPAGAVVALTLLEARRAAPYGPTPDSFRVVVRGAGPGAVPDGVAGQSLRGDTVVVARPDLTALPRRFLPITDSAAAPWTRPGPLVESTDPRVVAQMRQTLGRTRNAVRAAEALVRWVHGAIRPGPPTGPPSAAATLEARRGGASEQAALLAALARAAGIPARTVGGLRWAEGRFYHHAWVELYVGAWIAADPMLGQFPADANRIGLLPGGLARTVELAPAVGALAFEVP